MSPAEHASIQRASLHPARLREQQSLAADTLRIVPRCGRRRGVKSVDCACLLWTSDGELASGEVLHVLESVDTSNVHVIVQLFERVAPFWKSFDVSALHDDFLRATTASCFMRHVWQVRVTQRIECVPLHAVIEKVMYVQCGGDEFIVRVNTVTEL